MQFTRRQALQSTGAAALLAAIGRNALAEAQVDNLRIVTGFTPGGTSDTICRQVGRQLAGTYAHNAVVENRTGAGGQIAIQFVKQSPADGTTLLQTPTSMLTIYPHIYRKLPYDPVADLAPVSLGCVFDFALAVGPAVPANVKNIHEFLAWAKANPNGANFGSPAAGSTPHFLGVLLGKSGGVELRHIAYRGTQPAIQDMLGGNVSGVCGPIGEFLQHLPTGKVRLLGTSGEKRSRFTPDVPSFTEQGLKDMVHSEWFAFLLPAKSSPEVVTRMHGALKTALAQKTVVDGLATFGLEAMSSTPTELAALLKRDTAKWGPIVKAVGFTAET